MTVVHDSQLVGYRDNSPLIGHVPPAQNPRALTDRTQSSLRHSLYNNNPPITMLSSVVVIM